MTAAAFASALVVGVAAFLIQVSFGQSPTTGEWLVTGATSFPVTEDPMAHRAIALLLADREVPAA